MQINQYQNKSTFFLFLLNIWLFYLIITWRVTGNFDRIITDSLFYIAIIYLFWQRQREIRFKSTIASSFIGTALITIVVIKSLTLLSFENYLIFLVPFFMILGASLLTIGFYGIFHYTREFFLTAILFFPAEVAGMGLEQLTSVTILNTKVSTYILYYFGFNVTSSGNKVLLSLPQIGDFQAIVNYSCSGMPMIILLFKLALALIFVFPFSNKERVLIPLLSVITGFMLGVIRVCILTLLIPNPIFFDYWHGDDGSQIFSTLAIIFFMSFAYWWIQKQGFLVRQ